MMQLTKKRTKLVATIGPASDTYELMKELAANGMTTVRANFSHGDREGKLEKFHFAKRISAETGRPVSIMLDTKGPEIRVGNMKDGAQEILAKTQVTIECDPKHFDKLPGTSKMITVSYEMHKDLRPGNKVLLDDGKLTMMVDQIKGTQIIATAINAHILKTNKRINLPGIDFSLPFLSQKDKDDIVFGIKNGIDYIAASFVNTPENIKQIREILKKHDAEHIQVVAKIESVLGVKNISAIIRESDGIMIARGDLGLEIPYEDVPYWQKRIIRNCRELGKPVIVATQMLDSMENSPQPTRAEVTDVYYAVEQGADATMLSGETASGKFPVEAVQTMSKITLRAEKEFYNKFYYPVQLQRVADVVSGPRVEIAKEIAEKLMFGNYQYAIVLSRTGQLLRTISKFRPNAAIIGISRNPKTLFAFGIWSSVFMVENKDNLFDKIKKDPKAAHKTLEIYGAQTGDHFIIADNDSITEHVF